MNDAVKAIKDGMASLFSSAAKGLPKAATAGRKQLIQRVWDFCQSPDSIQGLTLASMDTEYFGGGSKRETPEIGYDALKLAGKIPKDVILGKFCGDAHVKLQSPDGKIYHTSQGTFDVLVKIINAGSTVEERQAFVDEQLAIAAQK